MKFYLGTHETSWLARTEVPLFIQHRRLAPRKSLPVALGPWMLDSGGFTELSMYGEWRTLLSSYVTAVRRYRDEIGQLQYAAPMDWMCEPWILAKTGETLHTHQHRTLHNFRRLRDLAPDCPFFPVLQGWEIGDYHRHVDMYARYGIDLTREPLVGVGSVCRRQSTGQIAVILRSLSRLGLRLHGFGLKSEGLRSSADDLASADSMSWSFRARRDAEDRRRRGLPASRYGCQHGKTGDGACANCLRFALAWRQNVLQAVDHQQLALDLVVA